MRASIFVLAACAGLIATAANAEAPDYQHFADQPAVVSHSSTTEVANADDVICRTITHEGVALSKPVCMTRRSWDHMRQQMADGVRLIQTKGDLQHR